MGITFNGYPVETIRYNGVTIEDLIVNNTAINMFTFDTSIFDKSEFSQSDILYIMEYAEEGGIQLSDYSDKLVGKLVTSLDNSLYSEKYRIIGVNHDGTTNTVDLLTEDCVGRNSLFGNYNRFYNDSNCYARKYVEDTFYNAFSSDVKSYLKPMEVKYYYKSGTGRTGGTLQANTAYSKLLSYNEIGYGTSGPSEYSYSPGEADEGNVYPYYNSTDKSLRIKKSNGSAVGWWLRSRYTNDSSYVGIVNTSGSAYGSVYSGGTGYYIAPVIRLGTKHDMDSIFDKASFTYSDITTILNSDILTGGSNGYMYAYKLVGKLVSGLTNSLYSGDYKIIGVNHDGTTNTVDLLTEDCVQKASNGFGLLRHYNNANCYARIFAEETFYNAFSNEVKSSIKPMEVKYYYASNSVTGTLQSTTRYGKLLSYNEIGYGISGPSKYSYGPEDKEGNLYPYFNNTTKSLRVKKYNGGFVYWWLRSRSTYDTNNVGRINTSGEADRNHYANTGHYLAPVIRLGK